MSLSRVSWTPISWLGKDSHKYHLFGNPNKQASFMVVCHINRSARSISPAGLFEAAEYEQVRTYFSLNLEVQATPLHRVQNLALALGISEILLKDESTRCGLNSFKILGVSYAVNCLLKHGRLRKDSVLVCATAGNHGRAVARVARKHALRARIYVPTSTVPARISAIAEEGAQIVLVQGNYDDAVKQAADEAQREGWVVISDTSWPGYEEIPRWIMAGYTQMLTEAALQWAPEPPPDLVLVQVGVGGLACAVASWFSYYYGPHRPFIIACEPVGAACLLESARRGNPVRLHGPLNTIMSGLRCGEVSTIAWPVLARAIDAFVAIEDAQAVAAMQLLAHPRPGDPTVVAGESGACGVGALLAIVQGEGQPLNSLRKVIPISNKSRVLLFNTEGDTDPESYARLTSPN